jgi:hypothetical protein
MTLDNRLDQIQGKLSPIRIALLEHPIYGEIYSINNLHLFMQHHVFAVWDFMCLLKSLQQRLCDSSVPWLPPADRTAARLVNEIVLGEESDEDGEGGFASHFDLYHRAMRRCGASTDTIDRFLDGLRSDCSVESALAKCDAPLCVRQFVRQTFDVIEGGDLCAIASAFTFGREDLLPDVFQRVVDELNVDASGGLDDFNFYLGRHIELDGDHHGPMAARMITGLCGDDDIKWRIAEEAAVRSLQARKALWDGMYEAMRAARRASVMVS